MINDKLDLKTISKNIAKMTSKEKTTFIETLLGISGKLSSFLITMQEKIRISLPVEIHYMMLMSITNIRALANPEGNVEIIDVSSNLDGYDKKLITILKQLNDLYKDELNDR